MRYLLRLPNSRRQFAIFVGDLLLMSLMIVCIAFVHHLAGRQQLSGLLGAPLSVPTLLLALSIYLVAMYAFEMYKVKTRCSEPHIQVSLVLLALYSLIVVFVLARLLKVNKTTLLYLSVFLVTSPFVLYLWRRGLRRFFIRHRFLIKKRILLVGIDSITGDILAAVSPKDYKLTGAVDVGRPVSPECRAALRAVNVYESISEVLRSQEIDILVTTSEKDLPCSMVRQIQRCGQQGVEVYSTACFYEILTGKVAVKQHLENQQSPALDNSAINKPLFATLMRFIDVSGSLLGLILLLPVFVIIALIIKFTSEGPVLFLQERLGCQKQPFLLIKFRTMVVDAEKRDGPSWATQGDARVTKFGRFLRKTRLDELPQLINILKGDMSFVGPRPIRRHFAELIEERIPFYSLRFVATPGLTGWAQVCHDYAGTLDGQIEKFQYDLYYLKHASLSLNLFIVLKTLQTIVCRPAH